MSITIERYEFEGPFRDTDNINDTSGIYVIICHSDEKYLVIDVGESATLKTRIENHERKNYWKQNCTGILMVAVYYTPYLHQEGRIHMEQEIRNHFNPPCGQR